MFGTTQKRVTSREEENSNICENKNSVHFLNVFSILYMYGMCIIQVKFSRKFPFYLTFFIGYTLCAHCTTKCIESDKARYI